MCGHLHCGKPSAKLAFPCNRGCNRLRGSIAGLAMRRRELITGLCSAVVWSAARAQQPAMPVIGFLSDGSLETRRDYLDAFFKGLAETGYIEGRNATIEFRWAEDRS